MLKITLPSHGQAEGFKVMSGDEDLTEKLCIRSVRIQLSVEQPSLMLLECYVEECSLEVLPENVNVNFIARG